MNGFFRHHDDAPPDYRGWLGRRTRRGNFVPLFRDIAQALELRAAAVALNIINAGQAKADGGGWQMASPGFLAQGTGQSVANSEKALAKLRRLGIAQVQMRGQARYVRLDLDQLDQVVANGANQAA
jgi:hypothetical protein